MKKKKSKTAKAATAALLALMLFQFLVPGLAGTSSGIEYCYQQSKTFAQEDGSATAAYTNTTYKYTNTTTESSETLTGAYEPDCITNTFEESWEIPGTPINETVNLYFLFRLESAVQFKAGNITTLPLYFGSIKLTLWFIGYNFSSSLKEAQPYHSPQIEIDIEEEVEAGRMQRVTIKNTTPLEHAYLYEGTLRELFGIANDTFITAMKLYAISSILREDFPSYKITTCRRDIHLSGDEFANVPGGIEKRQHVETWYTASLDPPLPTMLNWGGKYSELKLDPAEGRWHIHAYDIFLGAHTGVVDRSLIANFYYKLFQMYMPPGTRDITICTEVKTNTQEKNIPWHSNYYGITNAGTLQPSAGLAFTEAQWIELPRANSTPPPPAYYNYTITPAEPGWYYFAVFTPFSDLYMNINVTYISTQPLDELNSVWPDLHALSLDKIGKMWYNSTLFKNTSVALNITNTTQKWTEWNNKTYVCYYFNNGTGQDNITYNRTDYINGTWVPEAPPEPVSESKVEVNPANQNGSLPDVWFLKYQYTIYNCTVVELEKSTETLTLAYKAEYKVEFNYTEKLVEPLELIAHAVEGRLALVFDENYLTINPETLRKSYKFFKEFNSNQSLDFMIPHMGAALGHGKYVKNAWAELMAQPCAYGRYLWVPPEGILKNYYHYELVPPWALCHNYTCHVVESSWLSVEPENAPSYFEYSQADKAYNYKFSEEQIAQGAQQFNATVSLCVNATIYKDGAEYDAEQFYFHSRKTLHVHKIMRKRAKLYLKEDIWDTPSLVFGAYQYKLHIKTPENYRYNETGSGETYTAFTAATYPVLGFIFTTMSIDTLPELPDGNYSLSQYYSEILTNYTSTTNLTYPELLEANWTELQKNIAPANVIANTSIALYELYTKRTFPFYTLYSYRISPSRLLALRPGAEIQYAFDETEYQQIQEQIQAAFLEQNITQGWNTTSQPVTMPEEINWVMPEPKAKVALFSSSRTEQIIKLESRRIRNVTIVGFFEYFEITDRTEITFRDKDEWSSAEIADKLDTAEWLTYVKPMKAKLEVSFDKEDPKEGEIVNATIKLLIGNGGKAAIDGRLAAACQPLNITYFENGTRLKATVYTGEGGTANFTFAMPRETFDFKAEFDTARLELGSAGYTRTFHGKSVWDLLREYAPVLVAAFAAALGLLIYQAVKFMRGERKSR